MTVSSILANKDPNVVTLGPQASLLAAAELLDKHRIGAVVVVDAAGKIAGIMSERDVVRAISKGGPAALTEAVSAHMTAKVVTCAREDPHHLGDETDDGRKVPSRPGGRGRQARGHHLHR